MMQDIWFLMQAAGPVADVSAHDAVASPSA
jgi:hypothetical protein